VTVDDALHLARSYGVRVVLDGDGLALEADAPPPPAVLAILGQGKWDIVAALRLREAEKRLVARWINDRFTTSPAGICIHCGEGPRLEDPFVLMFVGDNRADVHGSCHAAWLTEREGKARRALGLEAQPVVGIGEPSSSGTGPR
jgi:hypothetical protein